MVPILTPEPDADVPDEVVQIVRKAGSVAAFTGAGISVESGIPDFRSPGGLWTKFAPEEYATLEAFLRNPAKAWRLYRALDQKLQGKQPNPGHTALARLEQAGRMDVVITQNVDGLHQAAGSRNVIELHGDHQQLQCLECGRLVPVAPEHRVESDDVPRCPQCRFALKPNVVLFGEDVREMGVAVEALGQCDLLLVVGTSAQVYPAAGLPAVVKGNGGAILEFNTEETALTRGTARPDFLFLGPASSTLAWFSSAILDQAGT